SRLVEVGRGDVRREQRHEDESDRDRDPGPQEDPRRAARFANWSECSSNARQDPARLRRPHVNGRNVDGHQYLIRGSMYALTKSMNRLAKKKTSTKRTMSTCTHA